MMNMELAVVLSWGAILFWTLRIEMRLAELESRIKHLDPMVVQDGLKIVRNTALKTPLVGLFGALMIWMAHVG